MAKSLRDVVSGLSPERQARIQAQTDALIKEELTLRELRRTKGHSQQTVGTRMSVLQGEISKLERRDDMYVSTLQAFIEALGGTLEITARFPDGEGVRIAL